MFEPVNGDEELQYAMNQILQSRPETASISIDDENGLKKWSKQVLRRFHPDRLARNVVFPSDPDVTTDWKERLLDFANRLNDLKDTPLDKSSSVATNTMLDMADLKEVAANLARYYKNMDSWHVKKKSWDVEIREAEQRCVDLISITKDDWSPFMSCTNFREFTECYVRELGDDD